jgi:arginase
LRRRIREVLADGKKPFILGGCCTQMIGIMAGARDALGSVGLAYIDGHVELYDGQTSLGGEAADLPLATLLGHGPARLLKAIGPGNVLRPADIALLGYRDLDEAAERGSLVPDDIGGDFHHRDWLAVRADPAAAGEEACRRLGDEKYFVYIDWDVLDERVFPATDVLMPDGLGWRELEALTAPLVASRACIGIALGCYNPSKDPGGKNGGDIVSFFRKLLKP